MFNQGKTIDQIALETGFSKTFIKEYIKSNWQKIQSSNADKER